MYSAFAAGGTLNSRQATSPLVRLVEGEMRWRPLATPGVSPSKLWVKPSRIVCMVLKAKANDRRKKSSP
ncbi:hypothetical protein TNCV_811761 [Trichonephila clavipes]|nr:hypothetical protein TNCV_811761 [Trichonephila clavipes]